MNKIYEALQPHLEKTMAFHTAQTLFEWDNETLAPKAAGSYTAKVIGVLSGEYFKSLVNDEVKDLVKKAFEETDLTEVEQAVIRELAEQIEQLDCIPPKEYRAYSQLQAESTAIWAEARTACDFDAFAPTLEKLINYQKKFAGYRVKNGQTLYDVMLDTFEKDFDTKALDLFFEVIKKEIVPLLKKVMEKENEIDNNFLKGPYDAKKQEELAEFLAEYCGFDFNKGILAVSVHPFTTNLHNHDVRITTHYEDNLDSSLFSVIHEAGHGIYEMGVRDDLTQTLVGGGASMGMHESQSRFFENMIGRNKAFWEPIYDQLVSMFPEQLKGILLEDFVKAINKVRPGLIRVNADELTYCLHIMVRYEMEKRIMKGDLSVKDLPRLWEDKYEEYLGIRPNNASEGILQDIHWSQGTFGYFPSYALGSAFAAQIYAYMKKELDVEGLLKAGQITVIRDYLRTHIHQYGKLKPTRELIKDLTKEDFTPRYYIEYLKEKYTKLYNLSEL